MISRSEETKFIGNHVVNTTFPANITAGNQLYPILPAIVSGTDYNTRLGDKVKIKSIRVYGYLSIDSAYTSARTIDARLLVLSSKNIKVNSKVQTDIPIASMLDDGVAGGQPITGRTLSTLSTLAPVNTNQFRVLHDSRVKLSIGNGGGLEASENPSQFVKFSFTIQHPANLDFDENASGGVASNEAVNFAPFITAFYSLPDGADPGDPNGAPLLRLVANSITYFDDA